MVLYVYIVLVRVDESKMCPPPSLAPLIAWRATRHIDEPAELIITFGHRSNDHVVAINYSEPPIVFWNFFNHTTHLFNKP